MINNILKKYEWKKKAKSKLSDPNRNSTDEYIKMLKKQSNGRCISCGVGKIKSYIIDNNVTNIKFSCGHEYKELYINENLGIRESIKMLLVPQGKGKRNFVVQYIQGWFKSTNFRLKDGVFKEQLIDKKNNIYKEKVINALNKNDVIKDQVQSLFEHQGYGSAKPKDEIKNYRSIPLQDWGLPQELNWNFDVENPVYNPHREEKWYLDDVTLIAGWVQMEELFSLMPKLHQLLGDEIWEMRDEHKINRAIEFWKNGGRMTPPLIDTLDNLFKKNIISISPLKNGVTIRAGFHRFSVCCLVGLERIPFLAPSYSRDDINKLTKTVEWIT